MLLPALRGPLWLTFRNECPLGPSIHLSCWSPQVSLCMPYKSRKGEWTPEDRTLCMLFCLSLKALNTGQEEGENKCWWDCECVSKWMNSEGVSVNEWMCECVRVSVRAHEWMYESVWVCVCMYVKVNGQQCEWNVCNMRWESQCLSFTIVSLASRT